MPFHLPRDQRKTAVMAGIIGNVMEWYDFALYGFMASIISELFFPKGDPAASLLATYGIFAAGFIMRPLGSALFGWMGDVIGRSRTMLLSVMLMTLPTFLLGLLPPYDLIGLWAPIGLVLIRFVQGLSVGGEFSSSVTYLVETAPKGRRGLSGSWANVGSMGGMLLGSGMATLVMAVMSDSALHVWGWRLPFLFSGVLGFVAVFMRRSLTDSEQYKKHGQERGTSSPIKEAVTTNIKETLQAGLFASAYGVLFYLSLIYIPTWLKEYVQADLGMSMDFNTITIFLVTLLIPFAGWMSDRLMRRTHLLALVFGGQIIAAVPLHLWMATGSPAAVIVAQIVFGLLVAIPCGVGPSLFVELFPTRDRLSGYSIAFNLGMGVIGGSTPMAATWLISQTGVRIAPALYMIFWAAIGLAALVWMKDTSREPLR